MANVQTLGNSPVASAALTGLVAPNQPIVQVSTIPMAQPTLAPPPAFMPPGTPGMSAAAIGAKLQQGEAAPVPATILASTPPTALPFVQGAPTTVLPGQTVAATLVDAARRSPRTPPPALAQQMAASVPGIAARAAAESQQAAAVAANAAANAAVISRMSPNSPQAITANAEAMRTAAVAAQAQDVATALAVAQPTGIPPAPPAISVPTPPPMMMASTGSALSPGAPPSTVPAAPMPQPSMSLASGAFSPPPVPMPSNVVIRSTQPWPDRNAPLAFGDDTGAFPDQSLERGLVNKGYMPTDKIIVKGSAGGAVVKFIKCNLAGIVVLVEMDQDGGVVVSQTDQVYMERTEVTNIPTLSSVGVLECASLDICGMAYECKGDICTQHREDGGKVTDHTFSYVSRAGMAAAAVDDIVAYPIIKYKDIMASPDGMLSSVRRANATILQASYVDASKKLETLLKSSADLTASLAIMNASRNDALGKIVDSIKKLEGYYEQYRKMPSMSDVERMKYRAVLHNLFVRYRYLYRFLTISEQSFKLSGELNKITEAVRGYTSQIVALGNRAGFSEQ